MKALPAYYQVIGGVVYNRHDNRKGSIKRITLHPTLPNILVKWEDGGIKSYNATDLRAFRS